MKLVCLSDTHTLHDRIPIPGGDILIHAGDMTGIGHWDEFEAVGQWFRSMRDRFKHRIIVAGNHDIGFEKAATMILEYHFDEDVIYLQDKGIVIDGVKFYGTPYMPQFYNWAFMKDEIDLAPHYNAIDDDTNVLITHGPPLGILDKNCKGESCGSPTLYKRVKELKHLKHHIFGHIHHSSGQEKIDDVTFHNVASLNDQYKYVNPPQVIEL